MWRKFWDPRLTKDINQSRLSNATSLKWLRSSAPVASVQFWNWLAIRCNDVFTSPDISTLRARNLLWTYQKLCYLGHIRFSDDADDDDNDDDRWFPASSHPACSSQDGFQASKFALSLENNSPRRLYKMLVKISFVARRPILWNGCKTRYLSIRVF